MESTRRQFLGRFAIAAGCLVFPVLAPTAGAAPRAKRRNKKRPFSKKGAAAELPVIKRISGNRVTVGDKTYEVSEFTKIIVDGEDAELRHLEVGMQASVAGGPLRYGETVSTSLYRATRIVARKDNQLAKKAAADNKKAQQDANKSNKKKRKK